MPTECEERMVEVLKSQKPVLFSYVAVFVVLICIGPIKSQAQSGNLAPDEEEALREIAEQLNKKDWNFNDPCRNVPTFSSPHTDQYNNSLVCNCSFSGNICHIERIFLMGQDLDGVLPASLAKLPYLKHVNLRRNDLSGSIPREWASTKLESLVLSVNNLSGPIPGYLGNITTLLNLALESNLFSGPVPSDLGKLINMQRLILRSNDLTGELPVALTNLTKLQELHLGSNNFTGRIPNYFQSWKDLQILEMIASGFEGPLPSSLSVLKNMTYLRIGDLSGESSEFPNLSNMINMEKLVLRSCNITGSIPEYISTMLYLRMLDLSFNRLEGTIPNSLADKWQLSTIYLTSNFLTGLSLPGRIKSRDSTASYNIDICVCGNIDLSYNNFSQSSVPTVCRETFNWFRGISQQNNSILSNCLGSCSKDQYSLHINCGGKQTTIGGIQYEGDEASGGAATFVQATPPNWGFSSTGHFVDALSHENDYIANNVSILKMSNSELYTTARLSPLSLTYYAHCLANGNYTVKLHFAEIVLRDNRSYYGLGRRMFDVYIQDKLVLKDFDIRKEALGVDKEVIKNFTAVVNVKTLLIRFQWAGRGTTNVPQRGKYGSLISAISVQSDFKPPIAKASKNRNFYLGLGAGVGPLLLLIGSWWVYKVVKKRNKIQRKKLNFKRNGGLLLEQQLSSGEVNVEKIKLFTSRELEKSTDNYNNDRIIGQGAQGVVYKGMLADGRIVAVKRSKIIDERKLTEFINEVVILSQINHRNVVQLLGCCLETDVPVLVYEFIPNGTLSRYISEQNEEFPLTWKMRLQIATEIAGALSYLHSAAAFPIYHRDIKSTNILLDEKFRAKVADFGISRSIAIDQTHLTTAVHGTFGYLDPGYFQSSQLTDKSDVYSFGVVLVELLTGQKPICARTRRAQEEEYYRSLANKFIVSMQEDILYEILDARVRKEAKGKEIRNYSNLALRCLDLNGRNRPTMREVTMELEAVQMLPENNAPNAQYDVGVEYLENDSLRLWDVVSSSGDQSASYDCPSSSLLEYQQSTIKTW